MNSIISYIFYNLNQNSNQMFCRCSWPKQNVSCTNSKGYWVSCLLISDVPDQRKMFCFFLLRPQTRDVPHQLKIELCPTQISPDHHFYQISNGLFNLWCSSTAMHVPGQHTSKLQMFQTKWKQKCSWPGKSKMLLICCPNLRCSWSWHIPILKCPVQSQMFLTNLRCT